MPRVFQNIPILVISSQCVLMVGLPLTGDDIFIILDSIVYVILSGVLMQKLKKENFSLLFCYNGYIFFLLLTYNPFKGDAFSSVVVSFHHL